MAVKSALFDPGKMHVKNRFFLKEARRAHDSLTNISMLSNPLLCGSWQFRKLSTDFSHLNENPVILKDAILNHIGIPIKETAIRSIDISESVIGISWDRQKDAVGEMIFIITCAIYESFLEDLEGLVKKYGFTKIEEGDIKKGFQFPEFKYDISVLPQMRKKSDHSKNVRDAIKHFPISPFMKNQIMKDFPVRNNRNLYDDFEMKMQTYLLFKKFRNCLLHGGEDRGIDDIYNFVNNHVLKEFQGSRSKICIDKTVDGYRINHFTSIGFLGFMFSIIKDIDLLFKISVLGEKKLVEMMDSLPESRRTGPIDRKKDLQRLKLCLNEIGLPDFSSDNFARDFLVKNFVWKGI